jgi:hypothetical protein
MHLELGLPSALFTSHCVTITYPHTCCVVISSLWFVILIFLLNPFISSLDPQKWLVYVWTWCNVESDTISSVTLRLVKPSASGLWKVDRHLLTSQEIQAFDLHSRYFLRTLPTARTVVEFSGFYISESVYLSCLTLVEDLWVLRISLVIQLGDYDLVPVVNK